jgi:N-sulfoglucosamine sulfohydrolase
MERLMAFRCFAAFLTLLLVDAVGFAGDSRPNLVLVVADDLSPTAGCYGNAVIKTPHLDQLARDGVRLTHAFATTASCSASRSVILTGLHNHANAHYGHEHAYHHFRAYDNVKSLPVMLEAAGYRTGRVGKLHVGPEEVFKWQQTFQANARNPVQMAEVCRPLIEAESDEPFFLYFCTADPHRSGGRVKGHEDLPDDLQPDAFGNTPKKAYPGISEVRYDAKDVIVPSFLPDTAACRAELAQYYQSVSRVDQGLGRLVELLKASGKYENTLIIFTSDHGMAFPGAKTTVYEPGLQVPMVVKLPAAQGLRVDGAKGRTGESISTGRASSGRVSSAMVSHVDLTPTLLDAAGALSKDHKLQGRSWLKAIEEEQPKGWDHIQASHTFHEITMYYPMRVVRGRQYKLIWNIAAPLPYPFASDLWEAPTWQEAYRRGPEALYGKRTVRDYIHRKTFELYDVQNDPDEVHNLAEDKAYAEKLAELQDELKAFQKKTEDPWALKWDYE